MMQACDLAVEVTARLLERNKIFEAFFAREARPLAAACREMSDRFIRGGRLLAFGRGPPTGDAEVAAAPTSAHKRGAMTFALPGHSGSYSFEPPTQDAFIHQELMEILYHTLWETVHVFLEHRELGYDVGESGFLYPFLGSGADKQSSLTDEVAASILAKAGEDASLRARLAHGESGQIAAVAHAIHERVALGGKLIVFGNGGSATDANDLAIDCVLPPSDYRPVPAISLSMEPANVTAIANDVGLDLIFLRQLIAHAHREDVAVGISTSGGSRNVIMALVHAWPYPETTHPRLGGVRVNAVHLKLGALAGVVRDALRSCWEMACEGTTPGGARLVIEDVPVVVYCPACMAERTLDSIQWFVCPVCKCFVSEVVHGRELQVSALEVQE